MKLSIDSQEVTFEEVNGLADDALIKEAMHILDLPTNKAPILKETLEKLYDEFLLAYYDVEKSLPEHEEKALLWEVRHSAWELLSALNNLLEKGNTDKRLGEQLKEYHLEQERAFKAIGDKSQYYDELNPNYHLRKLLGNITAAAERAIDIPDTTPPAEELKQAIANETNPEKREELEHALFFAEWHDECWPDRQKEYRKRVAARKTPKDLPLRQSIGILKNFFDKHVEYPFTEGKYYPELEEGFKSPAFRATKLILKKIYPEISNRKIAGIIQELRSG